MRQLRYNGTVRALPTGWDSVGPAAWGLLRSLARRSAGDGRRNALRELVGLSRSEWRRLDPEQLEAITAALPWLDVTPLRAPLRRSFRHRLTRYWLPEPDFLDGQALAYHLADGYFQEIAEPESAEAANTAALRLLATLARPLKGLARAPITSVEEVEARAERFRRLPPEHVVHGLMVWAGIRETVHEWYGEYLFKRSPLDKEPEYDVPNYGWSSIFQDVAEGGVFGDLAGVERANFHEVCQWLVRKEAVRRAQQIEMEKQRLKR